MKSIEVISPGMHTSFQDLGRADYAHLGCPVAGIMDEYHAKLANTLVQNSVKEAVLEISLKGPELKFLHSALICVTGLGAQVFVNGQQKKINFAFVVKGGDVLEISRITQGNRVYFAVHGGFNVACTLGSASHFHPLTKHLKLQKNQEIQLNKVSLEFNKLHLNAHVSVENQHYFLSEIEVEKGPEFEQYAKQLLPQLKTGEFQVSKKSNRMGIELLPALKLTSHSILTNVIQPGCVQLTPSGKLIVLMKDAQVSGGYPRVLVFPQRSMDVLSQKRVGEKLYLCFKQET